MGFFQKRTASFLALRLTIATLAATFRPLERGEPPNDPPETDPDRRRRDDATTRIWRVFKVSDEQAAEAVATAIASGYRSIDTAAIYRNEKGTGEGLRRSGISRAEMFVTTKLWNDRQSDAPGALAESLEKLGLDYLDLYLIHWPAPKQNQFVAAWQALAQLRGAGLTRAIGCVELHGRSPAPGHAEWPHACGQSG